MRPGRADEARDPTATQRSRSHVTTTPASAPTKHKRLLAWVQEVAALTEPERRSIGAMAPAEYDGLCRR